MNISSKNYFIVIDKNRNYKKDLVFNINFFYLKSFRPKIMSFSFINKPFFQGSISFGLDMKNKIRPFKFNKIQQGGFIPVNPRLFKKFLFAKENKFIAFSSQANTEELSPIMEMLRDLQYDKNKIKTLTFCKSCMDEQKFTILDKSVKTEKNIL